jgi:hypothetical protein
MRRGLSLPRALAVVLFLIMVILPLPVRADPDGASTVQCSLLQDIEFHSQVHRLYAGPDNPYPPTNGLGFDAASPAITLCDLTCMLNPTAWCSVELSSVSPESVRPGDTVRFSVSTGRNCSSTGRTIYLGGAVRGYPFSDQYCNTAPTSVYVPGKQTGNTTLQWTVPLDAPVGSFGL